MRSQSCLSPQKPPRALITRTFPHSESITCSVYETAEEFWVTRIVEMAVASGSPCFAVAVCLPWAPTCDWFSSFFPMLITEIVLGPSLAVYTPEMTMEKAGKMRSGRRVCRCARARTHAQTHAHMHTHARARTHCDPAVTCRLPQKITLTNRQVSEKEKQDTAVKHGA